MELNIDYVSDLHLTHYISKNESITKIDKLVQDKISMQVKGDILVVAGDIDEDINRVSELLYSCSKYYKKVIFVLGNHEYYIPVIKYIYTDPMAKEYNYNSMNKVYRLNEIFKDNKDIIDEIPKLLKTNSNVLFFKRSCSLKGYFAIIPYSLTLSFDSVWNAINEDFKQIGINIDKGTKNIDRVTFYSNDTDYFINENAEIYNKSLDITKSVSKTQNFKTPYNANKIVSNGSNNSSNTNYLLNLIKWLDASNISLETNYNEWQQIAMALISEFKDDGLNYFLELSKNAKEYNEIDATDFYNDHLNRYEDNNAVTFGTIKHLAKQRGYNVF